MVPKACFLLLIECAIHGFAYDDPLAVLDCNFTKNTTCGYDFKIDWVNKTQP